MSVSITLEDVRLRKDALRYVFFYIPSVENFLEISLFSNILHVLTHGIHPRLKKDEKRKYFKRARG